MQASRGGSLPLTIDLTPVTHLSSTGVRVLQVARIVAHLRVAATPQSPAHAVLELTGLGHLLPEAPANGRDNEGSTGSPEPNRERIFGPAVQSAVPRPS